MGRTPMTPEKFQSRDVKRRLSQLEKKREYMIADLHRLTARVRVLEADLGQVLPILQALQRQAE